MLFRSTRQTNRSNSFDLLLRALPTARIALFNLIKNSLEPNCSYCCELASSVVETAAECVISEGKRMQLKVHLNRSSLDLI